MVVYEGSSGEYDRGMESGYGNLIQRMEEIVISGDGEQSSSREYFQVLKAIESAELTIQTQSSEIDKLRSELQTTRRELDNYRSDATLDHSAVGSSDAHGHSQGAYAPQKPDSSVGQEIVKNTWTGASPGKSSPGTLVVHQHILRGSDDSRLQAYAGQHYDQACSSNGTLTRFAGQLVPAENVGFSQVPSSSSRNQDEGEYNLSSNVLTRGMMQVSDGNNMDLDPKIRERDEEIMQLQKHIGDYAIKEAQICNEKCILEKKISYMRTVLDQQQQDLVDAVSKATSYRLDILDENLRLSNALQIAEQERFIFVSSLFPLLAEYDLQPHASDAQTIVSNLKILIQHLHERVNFSEMKLKESQYDLVPWRTDQPSNTSFPLQSSSHLCGGLDMVPQQMYPHRQIATSSPNAVATENDWEASGNHQHQPGSLQLVSKSLEHVDQGPSSPRTGSNNAVENSIPTGSFVTQGGTRALQQSEIYTDKDPLNNSVRAAKDGANLLVQQSDKETSMLWSSVNTTGTSAPEDPSPSSYSPYLPPVYEEPSSSCSEAADDELLPAIVGLQIFGQAFPGNEIKACGYSINGTAACNFEWIREAEDGSVTYITGANQPMYVVTADDVDSRLAIEVVPMDNQKRKGDLIREFANDKKKITCELAMEDEIKNKLSEGQASFTVSLWAGYMDIWESATLSIKRQGYTIKCSEPRLVVSEKFSENISITIPYGHSTQFVINSSRNKLILRAQDSWFRDLTVLTLRLFQKSALQFKKKGKKGLFFKN